ncbi:uncharacterized protein PRCAT00005243001 [Priceomyces carsonii]|uniref:uncharacterized protein n=1 Tax=Priceomyces carsonii TaxID=28549 RepID=UPI002ED9C899|nr:unnamed protein product [Priceomyces carsonii]
MVQANISIINNVTLNRRGYSIRGTLILSSHHFVFSFNPSQLSEGKENKKEIWICYPVIERIKKARGSSWISSNNNNNNNNNNNGSSNNNHGSFANGDGSDNNSNDSDNEIDENGEIGSPNNQRPEAKRFKRKDEEFDHYSASHIRIQCKDFTYYSFDFINDLICCEVFLTLSALITTPKTTNDITAFYAYQYEPNMLEERLPSNGWDIYDPVEEYKRQELISDSSNWRISTVNDDYKFCPSYPNILIVPKSISDNVLKHAGKFRSKQRIPSVVYKHRYSANGNVIARCSQPLVGLNLQNRSIQDEKLICEIFRCQEEERKSGLSNESDINSQPQKNLIVDLRPITNAMAQHAMGAGTENIDNYRGSFSNIGGKDKTKNLILDQGSFRQVDKIFCNIDNIHVMRDSLNKLTSILSDLDKYPVSNDSKAPSSYPLLQQSLTKTQWLHRLSIILQSVDRITKSIHLNNTNVIIHCSDGWDRTSQVSALLQLCLDPYYRTLKGFMVLVEKEWLSFGYKFSTRADHGGCIGASIQKKQKNSQQLSQSTEFSSESPSQLSMDSLEDNEALSLNGTGKTVASFLQRAAHHIKNTAVAASSSPTASDNERHEGGKQSLKHTYSESSEKSPVFHQFLDCVYQIYRQHPSEFEFNSRFLKRLLYHYYSCQYGTFLCDSELILKNINKVQNSTVSAWDYFLSRPNEFINPAYKGDTNEQCVLFFNYTDIKWWYELYGRSDEEMNGLSNSLDRKFAQMKLAQTQT